MLEEYHLSAYLWFTKNGPDDKEVDKGDQIQMTVLDYILSTEWCHGLEPTASEGKYSLLTSVQQLSKSHEWLDDNL